METILQRTLLFDFYGELLTNKQSTIYKMYYLEDYSLQEISEQFGISRQGVRASIKASKNKLQQYENKLKLLEKHNEYINKIYKIKEKLKLICNDTNLIENIFKELETLNNK